MTTAQSDHLKKRFLEKFRLHGNITWACRQIRMTRRRTVYEWQEHDDTFAAEFRQAEIEATERMEEAAYERAVTGTLKPVYQQGAKVGTVREYSDTLLIFMLKARNPAKYRDKFEGAQDGQQPLKVVDQAAYEAI